MDWKNSNATELKSFEEIKRRYKQQQQQQHFIDNWIDIVHVMAMICMVHNYYAW